MFQKHLLFPDFRLLYCLLKKKTWTRTGWTRTGPGPEKNTNLGPDQDKQFFKCRSNSNRLVLGSLVCIRKNTDLSFDRTMTAEKPRKRLGRIKITGSRATLNRTIPYTWFLYPIRNPLFKSPFLIGRVFRNCEMKIVLLSIMTFF